MRIIAGDYKGRKLISPNDNRVRPTTDKVKEAIFSMLTYEVYDAIFIDLFAGTGSMGLEALSRGAKRVYFGDNSRDSISIIRNNVKNCNAQDYSVILAGDYGSVIAKIKEQADIIFLDPPYKKSLIEDCFCKIKEYDIIKDDGIIIAEHDASDEMPEELYGFIKVKEKKYGRIVVSVYNKE